MRAWERRIGDIGKCLRFRRKQKLKCVEGSEMVASTLWQELAYSSFRLAF